MTKGGNVTEVLFTRIADAIARMADMSREATRITDFMDVFRLIGQRPEALSILHWQGRWTQLLSLPH